MIEESDAVQLWTGLRVGEVAAFEWRDLDLDGDRPAIQLRSSPTNTKRADVLPPWTRTLWGC